MDYKNYRVGYHPRLENVGVIVFDSDISQYNYTKAEDEFKHIINIFSFPTYKYENYQNYLDENGLFMGIFPPEFIEANFREEQNKLEKLDNEIKKSLIENSKKPLNEEIFKIRKKNGADLSTIIKFINSINESNLYFGGYEFPIEQYYKDILIKYWGNYKV